MSLPPKSARTRGAAGDVQVSSEQLNELETIQDELEAIDDEASDRVLEIEAQFNVQRKPLFARRAEALSRIPHFWLQAIAHHPVLHALLTERDVDALRYLNQVSVIESEDLKSGYRIEMHFDENPYFTNSVLHKDFRYTDRSLCVTSSPIQWKEGKDLTKQDSSNSGKRRRGGDEETSFFSWFDVIDEMSGVAADQDSLLIAEIIKQELWVDPVRYYQSLPDDEVLDVDTKSWALGVVDGGAGP